MIERDELFIGGRWTPAAGGASLTVTEAATGLPMATVPAGDAADVDAAVAAAVAAFPAWSQAPAERRAEALRAVADHLAAREDELAETMAREVGTPIARARAVQVGLAVTVFRTTADALERFPLTERRGHSLLTRVAAGVVGAIAPWNYPLYQLAAKVAPAVAAGCTVVAKPSSVAPLAAFALAEAAVAAELPAGVLNIVTGAGARAGEALAGHPGIDMVSLTGSTGAGARVGQLAASDIKKVTLELGGKSAFLLAPDADLDTALAAAVRGCFVNNGQTCTATTRLLVPANLLATVEERLAATVGAMRVGDPLDPATELGPLASRSQQQTVLGYLRAIPPGARLVTGGPEPVPGLPERLAGGYFARPTVVSGVDNSAPIAREEIFGPVLTVLAYRDIDEAVHIANDSDYGLSGAVFAGDDDTAIAIARRLRTGQVAINGGRFNPLAPFGGFKKSGIGRELGADGLAEYFETTALQLPA